MKECLQSALSNSYLKDGSPNRSQIIMARLNRVLAYVIAIFLCIYGLMYLFIPLIYFIPGSELTSEEPFLHMTGLHAFGFLGVALAFIWAAIAIFRKHRSALPAYLVGLALDILANMDMERQMSPEQACPAPL